jgi:hypothetical protein
LGTDKNSSQKERSYGYDIQNHNITTIIIIIVITFMSCAANKVDSREKNLMPPKTIEDALKESTGKLMSLPGVVGTAQGLCDSKPCIRVYVLKKSPELVRQIPDTIDGYPVVIEETGAIHTLPENRDKEK